MVTPANGTGVRASVASRLLPPLGLAIVLLAFKLAIVLTWRAPAGDGVQYYQLAHELQRAGRFAFAAPPSPLVYSRLPAYPVLMALLTPHGLPLARHVDWATGWNLLFDAITMATAFLIVRRLGAGQRAALLAMAIVGLVPMSVLVGVYALTESLAAMITTLLLYLVLRWVEAPRLRWLVAAGIAAGVGQLLRFDSAMSAAAAVAVLATSAIPWQQRLRAVLLFIGVALAVFSPWMIRNQLRFGAPHIAATTWRTMDGQALPNGMIDWARTWSRSRPGEAYFEVVVGNRHRLDPANHGVLNPAMYDDEAERRRIVALYDKYNQTLRLDGEVDEGFRQLARERAARAPLRTYVLLPLERIVRLWTTMPEWELPFRVPWLGFPKHRPVLDWLDGLITCLAFGVVFLRRRLVAAGGASARALLLFAMIAVVLRTLLFSIAIPHVATKRYLAEIFPLLGILSSLTLVYGWRALSRRDRAASSPA